MDYYELKKRTIRGINTAYNNSIACWVFMPEGAAVGLGFKFYNTFQVIREPLIGRFGERDEHVKPGIRGYDGAYAEFTLSCADHEILVQSADLEGDLHLLVSPLKSCSMPPSLLIWGAVLWNKEGIVKHDNDSLIVETPGKTVRIHSGGKKQRQLNTGIANPYMAVELSEPVSICVSSRGKLYGVSELKVVMEKQRGTLLREISSFGDLAECYNAMRSCLAWNTIYEPEKDRMCSPVSRLWSISRGGYALFDWDTYFAALMIMQENKDLACANIIAITHEKTEEGFIPNLGGADDNKTRDRSQPPVGSFTVREFYKKHQEKWLVEYLFDDLLGWNRWFAVNRRLKNGCLCWGSKPFRDAADRPMRLEQMGTPFGAALESGMDNSPMYDGIPINKSTWMMELADVGLTGLYILDCRCLAYLAKVIARSESSELEERACLSEKGLETLWDEESGIYLNRRTDTGSFSRRISPTNFYALFSDAVPEAHVHRMVQEHFYNPREFYGEYMMPAISRDDPAYKDQYYWRGRIWAPTNYLVYIALARQGQDEACRTLAEKSRKLLLKEWLSHGHVHENYNCDTGEGCDSKSSDKFYHWGGLLSLIALMDEGYVEKPDFKGSADG